jgi:hypothetical protein
LFCGRENGDRDITLQSSREAEQNVEGDQAAEAELPAPVLGYLKDAEF